MKGDLLLFATFIAVGLMGFCTGSNWEISAIIMPIVIPLADALGISVYMAAGAVISGAALGSQLRFFASSHFLISYTADVKPMDIMWATLPYAITSALIYEAIYILLGSS